MFAWAAAFRGPCGMLRKGRPAMIKLTRLGGEAFVLNAELIRYVEARPDTFITLTTGERLVVLESMDEVLERAVRYQQAKLLIPRPHLEPLEAPRPAPTT
jgi:flagellar protein FlbD